MAYQKKYYYNFSPLGVSETHLVELWQDTTDVLVAEEVTAGVPPFVVEMPDINRKFATIRGTGCILTLLSDTDGKFFDGLYHVDPKEFMVYHYIDGVLNWVGYLNSEMFLEPYDVSENYIVSTNGNDGFNLMDRLFFLQADDSKYTGMKSEWELIQIALTKIGLPYTDIRISLSTTFADFTGAVDSTILHETYINCSNFYDEDDKPMTMREVLVSILEPYGAFIVQSGGSIYISDVNTMAGGGSVTYQKFNATTYAYIADSIESIEKDVTTVGYHGTGQQREISGGKNRQVVTYSPYPYKGITDELLVRPTEFDTVPATFSTKDGYNYRTLSGHPIYETLDAADFEESYYASGEHFVYYRHPLNTGLNTIYLKFKFGSVYVNAQTTRLADALSISGRRKRFFDGVSILMTGKCLAKTKPNPYTDVYTQAELDAKKDKLVSVGLSFGASIGAYNYQKATGLWVTSSVTSQEFFINTPAYDSISNKWVDFSLKMDLSTIPQQILSGIFQFSITSRLKTQVLGGEILENNSVIEEVWLRNLKFTLVNNDGSELDDSDIEYIGELNKLFSEPAETVRLTTGTISQFADRGMKCWNDGTNYEAIEEWTRAGQTYKIEELLLGSLSSNNRAGYISLLAMNLKNGFSVKDIITDTAYLPTSKLMVKSALIDYYGNVTRTDLVEVSEDELIIVKS